MLQARVRDASSECINWSFLTVTVVTSAKQRDSEILGVEYLSFGCGMTDGVGFNVPLNTLYVISGMRFTGQMTQPAVSKH